MNRDLWISLAGFAVYILCSSLALWGTLDMVKEANINIAALEQTVAELRLEVNVLKEQQQEGLQSVLGCGPDEAVCFRQHQETNENGYPGPTWVETWCCEGPEK